VYYLFETHFSTSGKSFVRLQEKADFLFGEESEVHLPGHADGIQRQRVRQRFGLFGCKNVINL
jgi:hypothetical protein